MKSVFLLLTLITCSTPAMELPSRQTKAGTLDILPPEIGIEILKQITGNTIFEAIKSTKRYYIAHPPSQKSVEITKAILAHLMEKFHLDDNMLEHVISTLQKLKNMTVFQNKEMMAWIEEQKERLQNEELLRDAARTTNVKKVKELISKGVNVNARNDSGTTSLIAAVSNQNIRPDETEKLTNLNEIISLLLNANARIDATNIAGLSPLDIAAQSGLVSAVQQLIQKGADPRKIELDRLAWGFQRNEIFRPEYKKILKILLEAGADANYVKPQKHEALAIRQIKIIPGPNLTLREMIEQINLPTAEKNEIIDLLNKYSAKK